ncbi:MAG: M14 family metallopeptidase [Planctomycetota bacterium]|nr:M14 family metallopeptidase [Planctomycetota bacterium]
MMKLTTAVLFLLALFLWAPWTLDGRLLDAAASIEQESGTAEPTTRFPYSGSDTFEGKIPTPDQFFGVALGDRFTPHHEVMAYCREVAKLSPRVSIERYGHSVEGRELVLLMISDQENISRLEQIESAHRLLADPRELSEREDLSLESLVADLPAVVWLSYNVHGDESSGTEAALATIHQLADGSDAAIRSIRENCLVIVDPLLNPDGRERYLHWYQQNGAHPPDPDPASREHSPSSPSGRSNHYLFDLNRDWAWQSQPETRARIRQYLRWQPQVHVDFHEMSPESTYFFFPPEEPINSNIPEERVEWSRVFGLANAKAFDRFTWRYYTAERFDLFYPAYGDSWPTLNGAIGMTYEQAGGGSAGLVYRRRNGTLLTLKDRLHHHHVAGLASAECAAKNRTRLLTDFHQFRQDTIYAGRDSEVTQFIIPPAVGDRRLSLLRLLRAQGIEMVQTIEEVVVEGLVHHDGTAQEILKLAPGTVVVPLDQPQGRLARTLLEPQASAGEAYFYDVAAWSLPMAFGVETLLASEPLSGILIPLGPLEDPVGRVEEQAGVAYLHRWQGVPSAKALRAIQKGGERVDLVTEAIQIQGQDYPAGTLVVRVSSPDTHRLVEQVAIETGTVFHGTASGWTDLGPDLGSGSFPELAHARIAVLGPDSVSSLSYGAVWSFLEQEMGIEFTTVSAARLARSLDRFDVLVIPSGARGSSLGDRARQALEPWVRGGGVVLALGSSAFQMGESGLGLVSQEVRKAEEPEEKPKQRRTRADLREERRQQQVPGNIVSVDLDPDHPLSFGQPRRIYGFIGSARIFELSGEASDVGVLGDTDPVVSGFISDENQQALGGGVWLVEQSVGRGRVVLFAGDPLFRSFWRGTADLFLNGLLLLAEES